MERIYLPLKLKCLLPTEVYKVADIMFACQKEGFVTYSPANVKSLHMPKEVIEVCLQTLLDKDILHRPEKEDKFWKFKINREELEKYNSSSWDDINNAPVIMRSAEVKFTHETVYQPVDMSTEQMMALMKKLQAQILSKQQKENNSSDGLPW